MIFDANTILIDAFVKHTLSAFDQMFEQTSATERHSLECATKTALELLVNCNCAYHDIHHTLLITDAGLCILRGRQMIYGDLSTKNWINAVVAMLFHDVGYLRSLLPEDNLSSAKISRTGNIINRPTGATDAFLTPYHIDRGIMYVQEKFGADPIIDTDAVARYITMTYFPVLTPEYPADHDGLGDLVRCADLIGQMADPHYLNKLPRLYTEFCETGEAQSRGLDHAADLQAGVPEFFSKEVQPHVSEGIKCLEQSAEGQQWIASLQHNLRLAENIT